MLLAVKNVFPAAPFPERGTAPLTAFSVGTQVRIVEILGAHELRKRIESMGIVVGSVVTLLQHRGHSVLLKAGHTRIAFRNSEVLTLYGEQFLPGVP